MPAAQEKKPLYGRGIGRDAEAKPSLEGGAPLVEFLPERGGPQERGVPLVLHLPDPGRGRVFKTSGGGPGGMRHLDGAVVAFVDR